MRDDRAPPYQQLDDQGAQIRHEHQVTALQADSDRLQAALKPFAEYADPRVIVPFDFVITNGSKMAKRQLTMGDCYEARRALDGEKR